MKIATAWLIALVLGLFGVNAQTASLEYQVKASYLYNFMQFVTWPSDVFGEDGKFNLCVVGAERFGSDLDAIAGEHVEGRQVAIVRLSQISSARALNCHMLFVADGDLGGKSVDVPSRRGLLTVGEMPGFLNRGGVINLVDINGYIRFEISQEGAQQAGLSVSSRILKLAVNNP